MCIGSTPNIPAPTPPATPPPEPEKKDQRSPDRPARRRERDTDPSIGTLRRDLTRIDPFGDTGLGSGLL